MNREVEKIVDCSMVFDLARGNHTITISTKIRGKVHKTAAKPTMMSGAEKVRYG